MRIYEKDYRYLLLNIVPQHRLSPALRRDVTSALKSGESDVLRRESLRALEALCDVEYFERSNVDRSNGEVLVAYRRPGGSYRVTLQVPSEDWLLVESDGEAASMVKPTPTIADATTSDRKPERAAKEPSRQSGNAVEFLPEIIRTFAITDRTDPVLSRLEALLDTLRRWLGVSDVTLDLLEDTVSQAGSDGERVRVISEDELRESELLRRAIETGAQRLLPKADLSGVTGPEVEWGVLGVAPIFSLGKVHGVLQVYFPPEVDPVEIDSQLKVAAGVVKQVIEFHVQIANLTSIDALTGIYNRHFFDMQLPVEVERAMRSGSVVSMLLIDIDDFKSINDELGHKKGDEALTAIAELIRSNLRKVDMPFRYGGEEFVILLPGTSEFEAVHTAERLRRVVAEYEGFHDVHARVRRLTISLGVAVYPDTAKTADDLFLQSDSSMYRAKKAGKNRVVLYKPDPGVG